MSQPELNDIPSNSHKSKENVTQTKDNRPAIPEFHGEVAGAKRKNSGQFWKWMRKMFLSDRKPSDIFMDVVENQVVPGIKDGFRNTLVSSVDMFIFPNSRPTNSSGNNISYSRMYNSSSNNVTTVSTANKAQTKDNSQPDLQSGFTNPCFMNLDDRRDPKTGDIVEGARTFLRKMQEYDYPTLSVHTLYMMRKQRIDYTWDAYGWTKEEIANVKIIHINNPDYPWMIDLPPAHMIS